MLTTRRADGHLVSRPMSTQRRTTGTDLWFMTNVESEKFEELARDPHVNLAYYKDRTREWVSVSGQAILTRDRDLIDALYAADWKAWLGDDRRRKARRRAARSAHRADPCRGRHGRLLEEGSSKPVVLFQIAKSMITGEPPKVADLRELNRDELTAPRTREELR